jgi:hypothetical protein
MNERQRRLHVTLTFTPAGDFDEALVIAMNDREEAILKKAIRPALAVLQWRRQIKRSLVWCFNHRILPKRITQGLFDLFGLRSV